MAVRHALEHVFEVGVRLDVVELCRGDEGADANCPIGRKTEIVVSTTPN